MDVFHLSYMSKWYQIAQNLSNIERIEVELEKNKEKVTPRKRSSTTHLI